MNFAFVACTVALWGLEYLLGLGTSHKGQGGATCAGWAQTKGDSRPPVIPTDQAAPNYSNRLLSVYSAGKKKEEIHRTDGLRPLHPCPRLPSNSGLRNKMEIFQESWAPYLIFLHIW